MSNLNYQSGQLESVHISSDLSYPSRTDADIMWSTSPFFRVSNTANFRGAASFSYGDGGLEVDEEGLVLATETVENEEKCNIFARLFSTFCLKLKVLGKRIGVLNCAPA